MLRLLPSTPNSLEKICLGDLLPAREVARSDLRVNLDARVWWNEVVGKVVPLEDRNAGLDNRVVFPVVMWLDVVQME